MENYLCIRSGAGWRWSSPASRIGAPLPLVRSGVISVAAAVLYCSSMAPHRRDVLIWKRTARALAVLTITGAVAVFPSPTVRAISPKDRRLESVRAGITIEAPAGWTLSQHTGYADTIVLLLHPDGCRISVTASATTTDSPSTLFEQNRPGLLAAGMRPAPLGPGARGSLAVDLGVAAGRSTDRPEKLRQLYLVRSVPAGRQAVILTLVCRASAFPAGLAALDFVATRLVLDDPPPPRSSSAQLRSGTGSGGAGGAPPR